MAKKVRAIPAGYHTITPAVVVGDARKAVEFYKKAFGAQQLMLVPGSDGKIMHAEVKIGDSIVMLSEEQEGTPCKSAAALGGSPVSFYVYVDDVDAAWKRAVDAGAKTKYPLTDMFWGDRTGCLEDPFGQGWTLAQRTKNLTPEEIKTGQEEFCAKMREQQLVSH